MLTLPKTATTYADKSAFCYRAIERLRLWHNEVGAKVDVKDEQALKAFREWARTEWEPRHKAANLTLHSLPGFTQQEPADYMVAQQKQFKGCVLTPAETAAIATMAARSAAKVAGKVATAWDKDIVFETFPRLNILGEPPDPTEDFTTYTEVDPSSHITRTAAQISYASLVSTEVAYVYKDKGVGHFAANFSFLGKISTSHSGNDSGPWQCVLSNDLGTWFGGLYFGNKSALLLGYDYAEGYRRVLGEFNGANHYWDIDAGGLGNTPYWWKLVRDEAVGTYGTLYGYWYDDAARTNLVASETLTLHIKEDFRYVYGLCNQGGGDTGTDTGYSADLDLGEQSAVPLAMHEYMTRRGR